MSGIGKRQRRMLVDMLVHGDGKWPDGWKFRNDHDVAMTGLWFRGYTTQTGRYAALTELGRSFASDLAGDRTLSA